MHLSGSPYHTQPVNGACASAEAKGNAQYSHTNNNIMKKPTGSLEVSQELHGRKSSTTMLSHSTE